LVLRHFRSKRRQLQYLMAQRLRVFAPEGVPAPAAPRGLDDLGVIGREEGPLLPFMPRLAARAAA
jgi:hypothetical protein